jgi:hypothetical protein
MESDELTLLRDHTNFGFFSEILTVESQNTDCPSGFARLQSDTVLTRGHTLGVFFFADRNFGPQLI